MMLLPRLFVPPQTPDRFSLRRLPGGVGGGLDFDPSRLSANGRTQVSPVFPAGSRVRVIIAAGQSNICSSETGSTGDATNQYTPTNVGQVLNLNVYDGGIYHATPPLLGCSAGIAALSTSGVGGNWLMRLGDKLIDAGACDYVVLVPIGASGTSSGSWLPNANQCYERLGIAAGRVAAVGLTVTDILWQQGESDHSTSQGDYESALAVLIAAFRDIGVTAPLYIAKSTLLSGVQDADVRAAVDATIDEDAGVWAGPDTDVLTLARGYRQSDDTHFNAAGADVCAELWRDILVLGQPVSSGELVGLAGEASNWQWDSGEDLTWG